MNSAQIEQKSYEMPPRDGFTVTHFLTLAGFPPASDYSETLTRIFLGESSRLSSRASSAWSSAPWIGRRSTFQFQARRLAVSCLTQVASLFEGGEDAQ